MTRREGLHDLVSAFSCSMTVEREGGGEGDGGEETKVM